MPPLSTRPLAILLVQAKPQPPFQALQHIENDGAGLGVIDRLPQAITEVAVQMGIAGTHRRPDFVDRTEVVLEKGTGELPRDRSSDVAIIAEIARAQLLDRHSEMRRDALHLGATELRMPRLAAI